MVFFSCADWLVQNWMASTIHLRTDDEKKLNNKNWIPTIFRYIERNKLSLWYLCDILYILKQINHLSVDENDGYLPPWIQRVSF